MHHISAHKEDLLPLSSTIARFPPRGITYNREYEIRTLTWNFMVSWTRQDSPTAFPQGHSYSDEVTADAISCRVTLQCVGPNNPPGWHGAWNCTMKEDRSSFLNNQGPLSISPPADTGGRRHALSCASASRRHKLLRNCLW